MTTPVFDHFEHGFDFRVLEDIPVALPVWYFPGGSKVGGKDGLLVRVDSPEAGPWVGMFAFGRAAKTTVTGIYTCPDKTRLCIVSRGAGVYISAHEPLVKNEATPLYSIRGVFPAPELNVLVMHDFARFVAYGESGIIWRTPCLSWDEVNSVEMRGTKLIGKGWSAPDSADVGFEIELETGRFSGGASPELHRGEN